MTDDTERDRTLLASPANTEGAGESRADRGPDWETQPMWVPQALLDELSMDEPGYD